MNIRTALWIVVLGAVLSACTSVNRDIRVEPGETVSGSLTTVNGSIHVGQDATVEGSAKTVNGSVTLETEARARHLETVNGSIRLGANARTDSAETVNGSVQLAAGARIEDSAESVNGSVELAEGAYAGSIESVNGRLHLVGAEVGSMVNVKGGMVLEAGSRVTGELRVGDTSRRSRKPPLVRIGRDCEVVGPLVFEQPVRLEVHETASIGEVRGAEPEFYSD